MLGIIAVLILPGEEEVMAGSSQRKRKFFLYLLAAFVFGTIACVNTWDLPVYAVLFATVLIVQTILEKRMAPKVEIFVSLSFCLLTVILLYALSYLFYWPFY